MESPVATLGSKFSLHGIRLRAWQQAPKGTIRGRTIHPSKLCAAWAQNELALYQFPGAIGGIQFTHLYDKIQLAFRGWFKNKKAVSKFF